MTAEFWDQRYEATPQVWSREPNALFAALTADLPPGHALDVAAGEGRTALWLARNGWTVDAVDFSAVGLRKGRELAAVEGLTITWTMADVTSTDFGADRYDLAAVLFLQVPEAVLGSVLARVGVAVRPGGRVIGIGHDLANLGRNVGGPGNAAVLWRAGLGPYLGEGWTVERDEQVERVNDMGVALDRLLVARREI